MRQRGFTYIELGAALVVLVLLASLIAPNLLRIDRVNREHAFRTKLRAIAGMARARALESGETVALGYDKGESAITAYLEPSRGSAVQLDRLPLPTTVKATRFSSDKDESPPDGWRLPFFVDGTTTGGGIEFDLGGERCSLVVPKGNGQIRVVDGPLPDLSFERWPAGSYERRL